MRRECKAKEFRPRNDQMSHRETSLIIYRKLKKLMKETKKASGTYFGLANGWFLNGGSCTDVIFITGERTKGKKS